LLRTVPDPHGDRLALAVVVDGPRRVLDRVRKRLRSISVDALTAGPSMTPRPVLGGWSFAMPRPAVPAPGPPAPPPPPGTPPVAPRGAAGSTPSPFGVNAPGPGRSCRRWRCTGWRNPVGATP